MAQGIDVSKHNGIIDWAKVKSDGIDFAFIRAGLGRMIDVTFAANIVAARNASIAVGVYWFAYALDTAGAVAEADYCCDTIRNYKLDLPVYYDFEYDTERYAGENGVTFTPALRTAIITAFCERIIKRGYKVGLYLNPDYINNRLLYNELKKYPLWLATWVNNNVTSFESVPAVRVPRKYEPAIWQFGKGRMNGINTDVDINYGYFDLPIVSASSASAVRTIKVYDKVKIKAGAVYTNGVKVPPRVVRTTYTVRKLDGQRALLLEISSWVDLKYLEKVIL